ncbi:MAG: RAD55 family ATPase, partial [Candidatus Thermoplasmatota archaeon]
MGYREPKRLKTYVKGLDERISGGIPEKQIVLVGGAHGTMKSTFCFSILYNLAKEEKTKCAYLTLEQGRESLIKNMQSLGMDVNTVEENLYIFDIGEIRKILAESGPAKTKMTWMDSILFHIEKLKEIENVEVVVLDSLNALAEISSAEKPTRDIIFHFFEKFR